MAHGATRRAAATALSAAWLAACAGGGSLAGGDSAGAGGAMTLEPACEADEDCGPAAGCRLSRCIDDACVQEDAPAGSPCDEGGGAVCDGGGACVECVSASDCAEGQCVEHLCTPAPPLWSVLGEGATGAFDLGLAADGDGNTVVAGTFEGSLDFGTGPVTAVANENGSLDAFVAKLNRAGQPLWLRRFGSGVTGEEIYVTTDGDGNVVLAMATTGPTDLGGGPLPHAGGYDLVVAKLDGDGQHIFSQRYGDDRAQVPQAIAVDSQGHIVVAGWYHGILDLGGEAPLASLDQALFVAKLTGEGALVWSRSFPFVDSLSPLNDLRIDASDNIVFGGAYRGRLDLGAGLLPPATTGPRAYVGKLDPAGELSWSRSCGSGDGLRAVQALAIDGDGGVLIGGTFSGSCRWGVETLEARGPLDGFVAKLGADGAHLYSRTLGSAGAVTRVDAVAAAGGHVVLAGSVIGRIDFGEASLTTGEGDEDAYLASLDASGAHRWSKRLSSPGVDRAMGLGMLDAVTAALVGHTRSPLDVGGALLEGPGSHNVFVAAFGAL